MNRRRFPVILCCLLVFTIIFAIFYGREDLGLNTIPEMENAIRSAVGQSEYSDLAVESKIEIQEIILGSLAVVKKMKHLFIQQLHQLRETTAHLFQWQRYLT